jgi:hypothetical protein
VESSICVQRSPTADGGGARGEKDRLTAEGLAEGYRLAHEAPEAVRSRYEDRVVVIFIFGLLLWAAVLFTVVLGGILAAGPGPLAASLMMVAAACIPLFLICRKRSQPSLLSRMRGWPG